MLFLHSDPAPGFTLFGYDLPRMHAVLNDLPAALLVAAVCFEVLHLLTRRDQFRIAGLWTLVFGAIGGAAAVLSGLGAEDHLAHGEAVHELMETHETLAFVTLGVFAVVAIWRLLRDTKMAGGERVAALVLALVGTGTLVATGVYGGKMVFEHAAGISSEVLEVEMQARMEEHHHEAGDADHDGTGSDSVSGH